MPTVRLTEKTLAEIVPPPGAARVFVRDAELAGFMVVVGARTRTFMLDYRDPRGRRRKAIIGRHGVIMPDGREPWNVARARQRARELVGQVAAGQDPGAARRRAGNARTLRDGLELHLDNMRRRKASPRSLETFDGEVRRVLADWLDRPIVELTAGELNTIHRDIRRAAAKRAAKRKAPRGANEPGAPLANRILRHAKAAWNALDREEELPGRNPARGVIPSELNARDTRVDDDEFPAWWATVQTVKNPVRRDLYVLALFTGVRSAGLRHLRWEDLDTDAGLLEVTTSKGGRPYTIPLGRRALALLAARRADNAVRFAKHGGDHGLVFPGFTRAREQVGREIRRRVVPLPGARDRDKKTGKRIGVAVHDLRRTFNSVAIEIGIPPEQREMLMNHNRRGVNVRHYGRPQSWGFLAECQQRIEDALHARIEVEAQRDT